MIYLKKFETHDEYSAATLTLPNVSLCQQENEVHYNPIVIQPNNEIWYTSTDGNIINLYDGSSYTGPQPISNTYVDGKGVMVFEDDLTSIGDYAFYRCENLASIALPESVTSIGNRAFYLCRNLASINIPHSVTHLSGYDFYGCRNLTTIILPDSLNRVQEHSFDGCISLTSITVKGICTEQYAFANCSGLTSAIIHDGFSNIGIYTFSNCRNLASIYIPNSVKYIRDYAFYYCSSLASINIPHSVTHIKYYAFSNCSSLTSITFEGTISQWNNISKEASWNFNVPATVVHCNDGDAPL